MILLATCGLDFIGSNVVPEPEKSEQEIWVCRQVEVVFERPSFDSVYHAAAEYDLWNGEDRHENLWQTYVWGQDRGKYAILAKSRNKAI